MISKISTTLFIHEVAMVPTQGGRSDLRLAVAKGAVKYLVPSIISLVHDCKTLIPDKMIRNGSKLNFFHE